MDFQLSFNLTSLFLFFSLLYVLKKSISERKKQPLPPGPRNLPIIGSLHHLLGALPHHAYTKLAKIYGPIIHVRVGQVPTVVISSPELAREVLKTHDVSFADRPATPTMTIIFYNNTDIGFSPYNEYWRQMRKICMVEMLSAKNVKSFGHIRRDEILNVVKTLRSSNGATVNMTERAFMFTGYMTCRSTFGKVCKNPDDAIKAVKEAVALMGAFALPDIFPNMKFLHKLTGLESRVKIVRGKADVFLDRMIKEHRVNVSVDGQKGNGESGEEDLVDVLLRLQESGELSIPITNENIKGVIFDMFSAGTETSSTTLVWALSELMRCPRAMAKAQAEVREALKGKETFDDNDIQGLKYLRLVVKETFRLHPPIPMLVPRECREERVIGGYRIPVKTRVFVNASAMGRDPAYWEDPLSFVPERFEDTKHDYNGNNFEFVPFGAGRRSCPGISFGLANVEHPLASLLYHFDWKLPEGVMDLDMEEAAGLSASRQNDLLLVPTPYYPK